MTGSGAARGRGRGETLGRACGATLGTARGTLLGAALGLAAAVASAQEGAEDAPPARPSPDAALAAGAEGQAPAAEPLRAGTGRAAAPGRGAEAAGGAAASGEAATAGGAEVGAGETGGAEALGPSTGLPLPRFVSLRASEARARRGPGLDHRVDWLYRLPGLPLLVTAEHGQWRRVEDIEGLGGWVHYSLISGERSVIVTERLAALHRRPEEGSPVVARLEAGVVASLDECREGWCEIDAQGYRGWTRDAGLWGVEEE